MLASICNLLVMNMFFTLSKRNKTAWLMALALVLIMGFALLQTPTQAVSQSELNKLKQQQAQLAEEKSGIQSQLDALSSQVASQTEKLELLTEQLEITNSEIDILSEQIALYTDNIARMENELTVNRQKKQVLLKNYRAYIRTMEENGSYTYLEILLGASSLEDLLSRIDTIREIMTYYDGLVNDIKEAQERIESAKADMEAEMAAQEEVFAAYQEKQADLTSQQEAVLTVLTSLAADSSEYETQLQSVNTLQASLSGQISDVETQLAELDRIRAEQEAANQAGSSDTGYGGNSDWYGDSAGTGTGTGQDIVDYAMTFLGVPYVYGGTSPSGFDCSGLVYYCYKHYGYTVNRTAAGLAYSGTAVSSSELAPGDVILFTSQGGSYIGHTGIYIGDGQFIHAPHTGDVVKISSLSSDYYTTNYWGARRIAS
ncbi:MAG TPA: hypothetical protein DD735_00980 [Clostridiales bacterium]|nr:hypothetical protein [Clostridiales bacterium]